MILRSKLDWSLRFVLISGVQAVYYHWHWANSSNQASKQWTSLNSKHFSKHYACIHVDIKICQRYLNSLLLTFFADGNHHVLQKGVFAPSCYVFTEKLCSIIKNTGFGMARWEREREGEEGKKREEEKESEEKGRRGKERHLPFGNGCGSGAHWVVLKPSKPGVGRLSPPGNDWSG